MRSVFLKAKINSIMLASSSVLFAFCLLMMPTETVNASTQGLLVWTNSVFPSLLPFLVTGELLIQFGVVRFIGVLFQPIMRPLFNVPGVGSFIWAIGIASGFPTGVAFTANMRKEKLLTKIEAERLVAFTNASNPIFIIAVIAVSFLKTPSIGILLVIVHYLSNILVGFVMRFYKKDHQRDSSPFQLKGIFKRAFKALHQSRLEKKQPFGKLLGDAVMQSIETLLMIGGFMIIFSVLSAILIETGLLGSIEQFFGTLIARLQIPEVFIVPFSVGLFEITIGTEQIANVLNQPLFTKTILISILLAFNGLSVHAQVASILANTDIDYSPYFKGRILQAFFSVCLVVMVFPLFQATHQAPIGQAVPVTAHGPTQIWSFAQSFLNQYGQIISLFTLWLGFFIFAYRVIQSYKKKSPF